LKLQGTDFSESLVNGQVVECLSSIIHISKAVNQSNEAGK